jgi:steroid delta-isomerase-like uncharacterized protein
MTSIDAEQTVRQYFEEVWNAGHVARLNHLLTSDYLNHSPSAPTPVRGPEGLAPIVREMRTAIPDLHYEILDLVATPNKVAAYVRMTGTHRGTLWGIPPGGGLIDVTQMQIEWLVGGRIAQHWRLTDERTLLAQLRGGV